MPRLNVTDIVLPSTADVPLRFSDYHGQRAVLLLGNQKTGTAVRELAFRLLLAQATVNTAILQIAHLAGVPRLMHRLAERDIRANAHAQLAQVQEMLKVRGLRDLPEQVLHVGLDWRGEVTSALGFSSGNTSPLSAVISHGGDVQVVPAHEDPLPVSSGS